MGDIDIEIKTLGEPHTIEIHRHGRDHNLYVPATGRGPIMTSEPIQEALEIAFHDPAEVAHAQDVLDCTGHLMVDRRLDQRQISRLRDLIAALHRAPK